jgi:cytochrome b6-f complex iron-sulfur subunit
VTSRRKFLNWLLGSSVGALVLATLYPVVRFLSPPRVPEATTDRVDAGPVNDPELMTAGFKILRFGSEPVILIRVGDADFRAFSATCTHLGCTVTYRAEKRLIWCWCHNGVYDLTGKNIAGPPPRPLTPFVVHEVPAEAGEPPALVVEKA